MLELDHFEHDSTLVYEGLRCHTLSCSNSVVWVAFRPFPLSHLGEQPLGFLKLGH